MAVIKIKKRVNPYVIFDKSFLLDPELSAKAKGVLSYLLSLPANWILRVSELEKHFTDGKKSIYGGLRELKSAGYVIHERTRNKIGHYIAGDYHVYEVPQNTPENDDTVSVECTEDQITKNKEYPDDRAIMPHTQKGKVASCLKNEPDTHLRHVEKQHDDNQPLLINNIYKEIKNTAAISEDRNICKPSQVAAAVSPDSFSAGHSFTQLDDISVNHDVSLAISSASAVISNTLTPEQSMQIHQLVKQLTCKLPNLAAVELEEEISYVILQPQSFSQAGNDFLKKLNTIRKCIWQGKWVSPAQLNSDRINADNAERHQAELLLCELTGERRQLSQFINSSKVIDNDTRIKLQHQLTGCEAKIKSTEVKLKRMQDIGLNKDVYQKQINQTKKSRVLL